LTGALSFPATAQILDDLVVEVLAAAVPAGGSGELLDAIAQAMKAKDVGRLIQLAFEFLAQLGEEKKLEALCGGVAGQLVEVGIEHARPGLRRVTGLAIGIDAKAEVAEDFFQRDGELADGDELAVQLVFEIVQDGGGGVADDFGVHQTGALAHQFQSDPLRGAGDLIAIVGLEDQAIRLELNHDWPPAF
jgi:hypothetical protein